MAHEQLSCMRQRTSREHLERDSDEIAEVLGRAFTSMRRFKHHVARSMVAHRWATHWRPSVRPKPTKPSPMDQRLYVCGDWVCETRREYGFGALLSGMGGSAAGAGGRGSTRRAVQGRHREHVEQQSQPAQSARPAPASAGERSRGGRNGKRLGQREVLLRGVSTKPRETRRK